MSEQSWVASCSGESLIRSFRIRRADFFAPAFINKRQFNNNCNNTRNIRGSNLGNESGPLIFTNFYLNSFHTQERETTRIQPRFLNCALSYKPLGFWLLLFSHQKQAKNSRRVRFKELGVRVRDSSLRRR